MEIDTPMHGHEQGEHDDSMNTTLTQSTIQALPDYHNGYNPASSQHSEGGGRPQTSYSDTGFSRPYSQSYQSFSPSSDADTPPPPRYGYNNSSNSNMQSSQQSSKPPSRPPSAMSGTSQQDRGYENGRSSAYQEQNAHNAYQNQQAQDSKNPKVIIKVGMVGDAQIGKTSLMVKYVEGSWDEDYIQTLGAQFPDFGHFRATY